MQVRIGDLGDPAFLLSLCQPEANTQNDNIADYRFDFILDDASHIPWHQVLGLEVLYSQCLKPGGVYIVEDIDT